MGELIDGQPLFPGESEIDQLYLIQQVLGPMTADQHQQFLRNKRWVHHCSYALKPPVVCLNRHCACSLYFLFHFRFAGLKFPELKRPEGLARRYLGKVSRAGLQFMKARAQYLCVSQKAEASYFPLRMQAVLQMDPRRRLKGMDALQHP